MNPIRDLIRDYIVVAAHSGTCSTNAYQTHYLKQITRMVLKSMQDYSSSSLSVTASSSLGDRRESEREFVILSIP